MELDEGRLKFITSWGNLGINWGVNRTMGQVHALLLISPDPMCADHIMEQLKISRGNVNMTLRTLIDWGLVHKHFTMGQRKEFFMAEKDLWKVLINIVQQRKRKELDPMLDMFKELSYVKPECRESEEFTRVIKDLTHFSMKADNILENLVSAESNWLIGPILRGIR